MKVDASYKSLSTRSWYPSGTRYPIWYPVPDRVQYALWYALIARQRGLAIAQAGRGRGVPFRVAACFLLEQGRLASMSYLAHAQNGWSGRT